ncbi:MAG: RdgB/HAM1 family non-canonical purine NTP pyrophosphatase [Chloroflexota bacterium]
MRNLLVATRNPGKVLELADMLRDLDVAWLSLADLGLEWDVPETGQTFEENAVLKAQTYATTTGLPTLADDSGLEVDALGGRPGVYTARYGGPGLTPIERYTLLLEQLRDVPWAQRTARFRCVVALADPATLLGAAAGVCEGYIALAPAGQQGFGYDPIFHLPDLGQTMAQLEPAVKHRLSHRGRAVAAIAPLLRRVMSDE